MPDKTNISAPGQWVNINGYVYNTHILESAWDIVTQLAELYTVDTDQVHVIRLVAEAKRLVASEKVAK